MWHETLMPMWPIINRFRWLLIPTLEKWFRFVDGAKLIGGRLVGQKTVKETIRSNAIYRGKKFLIFATYPTEELLANHIRLLKKFENRGYTIIVVSNSSGAKKVLTPLLDQPWIFVFRRPFGRDFGCYKDCALMLYEHHNKGGAIERVILLNDSVVTFEPGEDKIVDHLDNPNIHYAGITENYEFNYHVGSFMVAMSGEAFMSKRVTKFWKNYRPISTRRYSIHKGEMGLTRALKRSGYVPRVLYTLSDFKCYLESIGLLELEQIYHFMEPKFHNQYGPFVSRLDKALDAFIRDDRNAEMEGCMGRTLITAWPKLKKIQKPLESQVMPLYLYLQSQLPDMGKHAKDFDDRKLYLLRYRDRLFNWKEESQKDLLIKRAKEEIIDSMLTFVFKGSQIHSASALLLYMGAGILKKDVVYRGHVEPYNLGLMLSQSGASASSSEIFDVSKEVLAKGHPYSFQNNLIKRMLYEWGFI